jgi:hypothetical protein
MRRRGARCALWLATSCLVLLLGSPASADGALDAVPPDARECVAANGRGYDLLGAGHLRAARDQFLACARPSCPAVVVKDCAAQADKAEDRIPTVVLVASVGGGGPVSGVLVTLDDTTDQELLASLLDGRAVAVDPGDHRFRFVRGDGEEAVVRATVPEGAKRQLVVATFPARPGAVTATAPAAAAPPPSPGRATGFVLAGVTAAAFATSAVFGVLGKEDLDALQPCRPDCSPSSVDATRRAMYTTDVSLILGVIGAGVTLWWWLRPGAPRVVGLTPEAVEVRF